MLRILAICGLLFTPTPISGQEECIHFGDVTSELQISCSVLHRIEALEALASLLDFRLDVASGIENEPVHLDMPMMSIDDFLIRTLLSNRMGSLVYYDPNKPNKILQVKIWSIQPHNGESSKSLSSETEKLLTIRPPPLPPPPTLILKQ